MIRLEQNAIVIHDTANNEATSWLATSDSIILSDKLNPSGIADKKLSLYTLDKNVAYKTSKMIGVKSEEINNPLSLKYNFKFLIDRVHICLIYFPP
jgi:hypothetical protein